MWGGDGYAYDDSDCWGDDDSNDARLDAFNIDNRPEFGWIHAVDASKFYEDFKLGFCQSTPFVPSGDKAIDMLELASRDITDKYMEYATKKWNDDPLGPFDSGDYIAWEKDYYAKRDAAKKIQAVWRSYKSK